MLNVSFGTPIAYKTGGSAMQKLWLVIAAVFALAAPLSAQMFQNRARITGTGNSDRGKCTIEVVVDGVAEVEIHGDSGILRNLSGQPPQWRRFECTAPMPPNPVNVRFRGIDGRGRQELGRDPRNSGAAVVRITDPSGGAEAYTFDLTWDGGGYESGRPGRGRYDDGLRADDRSGYRDRAPYGRFSAEDTLRVCEEAVRQEAIRRFNTPVIAFRRANISDNPGPRDWISGIFDVRRGGRNEAYRFSCAVNFDTGRVRSMRIETVGGYGPQGYGDSNPRSTARATEICERAVEERLRRDGYEYVDFGSLRVDDRPGRGDWIIGNVTANRGRRPESINFSCSVDLANGSVRSVDVTRR